MYTRSQISHKAIWLRQAAPQTGVQQLHARLGAGQQALEELSPKLNHVYANQPL